jgi:hypothetical protein
MTKDLCPRLSPNLGLLDARATGRTFSELGRTFLPVDFFDLCSMIEEMVLRDKIVLVGKYDMLPRDFRTALTPFVQEKVFELCLERVTLKKLGAVSSELLRAGKLAHDRGMTSSTIEDSDHEVARLLAAEIALNVPTISMLRHLHNFGHTRRPDVDHTVCDLSVRFGDIKALADEKLRFLARQRQMEHIALPPIALEVMQRAHHFDDLPTAILEARDDYRHLREEKTRLAVRLNDPRLGYESYRDQVRDWNARWSNVGERAVAGDLGLGLTSFKALGRGAEFVVGLSTSDYVSVALNTLALASDARDFARDLLFRPVYYTVRNYMRNQRVMAQTIGNIFELDPVLVHRQLSTVASHDSVWRHAMANLHRAA